MYIYLVLRHYHSTPTACNGECSEDVPHGPCIYIYLYIYLYLYLYLYLYIYLYVCIYTWFCAITTALPPRATASVVKTFPTVQTAPAAAPGANATDLHVEYAEHRVNP